MENKYQKAMNHVEVSDEMRSRVLNNISDKMAAEKKTGKITAFPKWSKLASLAAVFAICIVGTMFYQNINKQDTPQEWGPLGIEEFSSLSDLEESAGFNVEEVHDLPFSVTEVAYSLYQDGMAECIYYGESNEICYRKSRGDEDNSGLCYEFEEEKPVAIGDREVTLKAFEGGYRLAVWTFDGYSYSLSTNEALTIEEWTSLILSIE